jgi:glycosyltransferase involved in cell wall biosynthesis
MSENPLMQKINNHLFQSVDGFVFLTEQMNQRLNKKKKPYIVLEGHVDADAPAVEATEKWEEETSKKIIIYAGSILKLYGIQNLTEGFVKADLPDTELWVYGDGDYREELIELSRKHPSVIYQGVCSNQDVVASEMKAALLVNPRPVAPEYTKYSFPSKNMEYMVSGTPVLTTKLPGMPESYYPYVYLLEDESPEGVAKKLKEIMQIPMAERHEKAARAREYVLRYKSNVAQAKKIIEFLKEKVDS